MYKQIDHERSNRAQFSRYTYVPRHMVTIAPLILAVDFTGGIHVCLLHAIAGGIRAAVFFLPLYAGLFRFWRRPFVFNEPHCGFAPGLHDTVIANTYYPCKYTRKCTLPRHHLIYHSSGGGWRPVPAVIIVYNEKTAAFSNESDDVTSEVAK